MKCDQAQGAAYADGLECQEYPTEGDLRFYYNLRSVSTNFDPKRYSKYGTYQLYFNEAKQLLSLWSQIFYYETEIQKNYFNKLRDNFFLFTDLQHLTTTYLSYPSRLGNNIVADTSLFVSFQLNLTTDGYYQESYSWARVNLLDFAGNFTSQALSILAFVAFFMAGINRHAQNNNLIKKLYGETGSSKHRTFSAHDETVAAPFANAVFQH